MTEEQLNIIIAQLFAILGCAVFGILIKIYQVFFKELEGGKKHGNSRRKN